MAENGNGHNGQNEERRHHDRQSVDRPSNIQPPTDRRRITTEDLFERVGIDLYNYDDIQRFVSVWQMMEKQWKRKQKLEEGKTGWLVSVGLVVLGSALAALTQIIESFINSPK